MPSPSSIFIVASAGSGKTTHLVESALAAKDARIAVLTYTNNNIREIRRTFCLKNRVVPERVDVIPWFTFLLRECARPYQSSVYADQRVETICFVQGRSVPYAPRANTGEFFFSKGTDIYNDKISRFVVECEANSGGLVTQRLSEIYDIIFVDEFQDLAGYDLSFIEMLLKSGIPLTIVGDPRQCTYSTNNSPKNSRYHDFQILEKVFEWEAAGLCRVETHAHSHRCNQQICDFVNGLWPNLEPTKSENNATTDHDGLFIVSPCATDAYVRAFNPAILRYDRRTDTHGYPALNFGNAKGLTFDRVLIFPHGPIRKYLKSADINDVRGSLCKFYVAVTRARHSVSFVYDGECNVGCTRWA